MIPSLLLPAGLAALAALALPLLLHLVRRDDQRPIDFAALRWLTARVRPRRRLRFEDRLLLALRLLLIVLLALLLARPVLPLGGGGAPWIVAAPGVGGEALRDAEGPLAAGSDAGGTSDSMQVQRRWLAAGFPALDEASPPDLQASMSLLRELDMRMPAGAPLVVLVPPVLAGVDAERPRLSRPVEWRVISPDDASSPGDEGGSASTDAEDAGGIHSVPAPRILIRDAGNGAGARYLRAAAAALQAHRDRTHHDGGGLEVQAWLTSGQLPSDAIAWIEAGGTALLAHDTLLPALDDAPPLWRDDLGRPLLRRAMLGKGRILQWTRPLEPDAMPALLDPDFPHRLSAALQPPPPPSRVLAAEHFPLAGGIGPWPPSLRELSPWLALAIALLFALERWLAAGPRREGAP
jgi:hypothetical protein